jgi:hypothetical protein
MVAAAAAAVNGLFDPAAGGDYDSVRLFGLADRRASGA